MADFLCSNLADDSGTIRLPFSVVLPIFRIILMGLQCEQVVGDTAIRADHH